MKNKLMLTALLGLLLVGSFAYAEESDDEAKKRLLKEYEKVQKEREKEAAKQAKEAECQATIVSEDHNSSPFGLIIHSDAPVQTSEKDLRKAFSDLWQEKEMKKTTTSLWKKWFG